MSVASSPYHGSLVQRGKVKGDCLFGFDFAFWKTDLLIPSVTSRHLPIHFVSYHFFAKKWYENLRKKFNGETTACARHAPLNRASLFAPMGQSSLPFLLGTPRRVMAKSA